MKSRVHPRYKTKYRVGNWPEYERALVQRGDITLWLSADATDAWTPSPSGRRGARDTTLSRRSQHLGVKFHLAPANEPVHLIVDSSGLSIAGEGEWTAVKHGGRGTRGWKKLHLGVDGSGAIVAHVLTDGNVDDAQTGRELIDAVDVDLSRVSADGAYDTIAIYEAAAVRGATVVIPPTKTAAMSRRRPRSSARDRTIMRVQKIGRRRWKRETGYHRQARAENASFRYKSIIGDRLRARHSRAQAVEATIACNILNRMTELGRPASTAIGRWNRRVGAVFYCSGICAPTPFGGSTPSGEERAIPMRYAQR